MRPKNERVVDAQNFLRGRVAQYLDPHEAPSQVTTRDIARVLNDVILVLDILYREDYQ